MGLTWSESGLRALALAAALIASLGAAEAASLAERIEACAACHGAGGASTMENIPSLAGQPEFFVMNQLILMREGVRRVEPMTDVVKDLKDEDILALAAHFAKAPPARTPEPVDAARAAAGAPLAETLRCASCHLPNYGGQEQIPRLAGQRVDYMIAAMKAYRDNTRSGADTQMAAVVYGLTDAQIEALAHYASSK
jgi:cytochrome c553